MPSPLPRAERRSRLLSALALSAGLAVVASGCSVFSPQTTAMPYAPSDGHEVDLSPTLGVRNALIIAATKGSPGQLYGTIVNTGDQAATVTFSSETGSLSAVQVPARTNLMLDKSNLRIAQAPQPGTLVPFRVSSNLGAAEFTVPVLDGTLAEYKTLVPTGGATTAAVPSATATS